MKDIVCCSPIKMLIAIFILQGFAENVLAQGQCDIVIKDTKPKIIFTPNYPDDYENYRTCNYVIEKADSSVCRVELEVIDFSLESDNKCASDYFDLGEGYKKDNGGLTSRRLCGNVISGTKKELFFTNYNTLTARFSSDGTGNSRGFSIKVKQIPNSCFETRTSPPPPSDRACRHDLQGEFVTVTSPNYPRQYPPNQDCSYKIQKLSLNVCTVKIKLDFFHLDGNTPFCYDDYLELPSGEKLCGRQSTERTIQLHSGSSDIYLRFHANGVDQREGFRIVVQQLRNSCNKPTNPGYPGTCRIELRDLAQTITSPGFPSTYPANIECQYILRKHDRSVCKVEMEIRSFDITGTIGCRQEYLRLPDGQKICGKTSGKRTLQFGQNRDEMTLTFLSGRQTGFHRHAGFQIQLTQRINSCSGFPYPPSTGICDELITEKYKRIQSPQINGGNYGNNQKCIYTIKRYDRSTCRADVDFRVYDIESSTSCLKDSLKLPNGFPICGKDKFLSERLTFPSGNRDNIEIVFTSDSYGTGRGFEMIITQRQGTCDNFVFPDDRSTPFRPSNPGRVYCGKTYSTETFFLKSPGFQTSSYFNNQDCTYNIKKIANNVCALQLTYHKFDVQKSEDCLSDYFEVDGVKNCGRIEYDSIRTYRFTRDTEILKFHSDSSVTGSGFFITGKQLRC